MNNQHSSEIVFDYTTFLGATCKKKWTFLEAMQSFAPVFGMLWKDSVNDLMSKEDPLWEQALTSLSAQNSDEANLVRLVKLARVQGIGKLTLKMPYELDVEQRDSIGKRSRSVITELEDDSFTIEIAE